jgi:hypothetical protein
MSQNLAISTIESEIVEITAKLRPADDASIGRILGGLLEFGFVVSESMPSENFKQKYIFSLNGVSEHALKIVAAKLARGEYPEIVNNFLPIPAEFAKLARAEERVLREDRTRLRIKLESGRIQPEEKRSPERQERIREMVANARRATTVMRGAAPEPAIDGERAEYIKRIMAIRDRDGITAEEQTRRRKPAADIERYERENGGEDA